MTRHQLVWLLVLLGCFFSISFNSSALAFEPDTPLKGGVLLAYDTSSSSNIQFLKKIAQKLSRYGWRVSIIPIQLQENNKWERQLSRHISEIRQRSNTRVILVSYALHWAPLKQYFIKPQAKNLSGLVLVSTLDGTVEHPTDSLHASLRFPIFDVVAQFDYPIVLEAWKKRQDEPHVQRREMQLMGSDHDYPYHSEALVDAMNDWMSALPVPKVGRIPAMGRTVTR